MTVPSVHCEALKVAYRQTKDGLVVSFVIHPNDMPDALAVAPLGTRYMLVVSQIGDDEQPVPPDSSAGNLPPRAPVAAQPAGEPYAAKERRPWHTLPPQQRAGMLCADRGFQQWVSGIAGWECDEQDARDWLCGHLGIKSRADIPADAETQQHYEKLEAQFMRESGRAVEVR